MSKRPVKIAEPKGKLAVLIPGMGAVATTFIAGVEAARRNLARPIGSLTQMGTIRLGRRTENRTPMIKDFVPIAGMDDLVFGGWDLFKDNSYDAAVKAGVLDRTLLDQVKDYLTAIRPMPAVFEQKFVKRLRGENVKKGKSKMDLAEQVMDDIRRFQKSSGATRAIMIWCGSTEVFSEAGCRPSDGPRRFEKGLRTNSKEIAPSMIYAYAALKLGIPFANGAPNLTVDIPAMRELSQKNGAPICGKDFKTGQTLIKTISRTRVEGPPDRPAGGGSPQTSSATATEKFSTTPALSRQKRRASSPCSNTSCNRSFILTSTKAFTTKCGSITIRRAATIKKGGTTSTSSAGSATRCSSKSISFAAIRYWPLPSCSTWSFCLTSRSAAPRWPTRESRSGCRSISRARCARPTSTPSMTSSSRLMKLKNTLRYLRGEKLITHLGVEYYD